MSLTAQAPLPVLFRALDRAEWGDLTGAEWQGVRTTLRALGSQVNPRTGEGFSTATQVAGSAGLTERWVRRCLRVLEDAGLIVWRRGGASHGQPVPSHFRIVKHALLALIRHARGLRDDALPGRWATTRARIASARFTKTPRYRRSGPPPELSTGSSPLKGEGLPSPSLPTVDRPTTKTYMPPTEAVGKPRDFDELVRAARAQARERQVHP